MKFYLLFLIPLIASCVIQPGRSYEQLTEEMNQRDRDRDSGENANFEKELNAIASKNEYFYLGNRGYNPCKKNGDFEPLTVLKLIKSSAWTQDSYKKKVDLHFTDVENEAHTFTATISKFDYENRQPARLFENCFLQKDPKKKYKFSKPDIALIKANSLRFGFSKDQTLLSVGRPDKINVTETARTVHEQWVYPWGYIYFFNNSLRTWQN